MNRPLNRIATIDIRKQYLHFSAAHFTIFSATERERLHGHNWQVAAKVSGPVGDDGLCFDYAIVKARLKALCEAFDEYTLIAELSPHLSIREDEHLYYVTHNGVEMPLLKSDTLLLPLRNTTIEELSGFFLQKLLDDASLIEAHDIQAIQVQVASGPDQWGISNWQREK
jgi:6-pyruvoyltetrahydropterin/6-carboxytetrahydropterin synthase